MLQPKQMPHGGLITSRTRRKIRTALPGKHSRVFTARTLTRLLVLMLIGVAGITVPAQQSSVSNIVGHVSDSTGAVIAGATVFRVCAMIFPSSVKR